MRIPIESSTSYRGRNARPNWASLVGFIALALGSGAIGLPFSPLRSAAAAAWYASLSKPEWVIPTPWAGPLWLALYGLMGAAAWLGTRERYHRKRGVALLAYLVQLALNAVWAPLFFGGRNIGAGLFVLVALWLATVWTLREFATVRASAAWLLAPGAAWVSFVLALNFSIWRLNP